MRAVAAETTQLDEEVCHWLEGHRVVNEKTRGMLLRIQSGKLALLAFGYGGAERTRLCADLIAWLFLFDDAYADGAHARDPEALQVQHERIYAILAGTAVANDPFGKSLIDLYERLGAAAPRAWLDRLTASIRGYFEGCEVETSFRLASTTPSIESYLAYRDRSIGVYPMLDCIELANGSYLSEVDAASPFMLASRRAANLVIALTNDLHSAKKEAAERDSFNAVAVLQRQHGYDLATAVQQTRELQERLLAEHRHFERVASRAPSESVTRYFKGVDIWFAANERWSGECPRYNLLGDIDTARIRA